MNASSRGRKQQSFESPLWTDTVVVAADQQVSTQLGEEAVILHVDEGIYYGLDPIGTTIWQLLQEPRTIGEIRDHIVGHYDVERERCERDLIALLQELLEHRLVELPVAAS